jgi:hypothetical protein
MIVFEDLGVPLTVQQETMAADTSVSADDDMYSIKIYRMAYDSGGTSYMPILGDLIIGATSAARGIVLSCSINDGTTWAGGDGAGVIYMYAVTGTWQNNEVFNVVTAADSTAYADEGTVDGLAVLTSGRQQFSAPCGTPIYNGMQAKAAIVVIETNSARITLDGTPATPGTLTNGFVSRGVLMAANTNWVIRGVTPIKNIKLCNATASSNMAYRIMYYF